MTVLLLVEVHLVLFLLVKSSRPAIPWILVWHHTLVLVCILLLHLLLVFASNVFLLSHVLLELGVLVVSIANLDTLSNVFRLHVYIHILVCHLVIESVRNVAMIGDTIRSTMSLAIINRLIV